MCVKFSLPKVILGLSISEVVEENSSDSNALMALKGDGSWHSHWFIARYAQTTPTNN